jgi:hypothetical protein
MNGSALDSIRNRRWTGCEYYRSRTVEEKVGQQQYKCTAQGTAVGKKGVLIQQAADEGGFEQGLPCTL